MKRSGGRRYYRPDDVDLLRGIRHLLYSEGYTIRGVQRILKEHGIKSVQGLMEAAADRASLDALTGGDSDPALLEALVEGAVGHDDGDDDDEADAEGILEIEIGDEDDVGDDDVGEEEDDDEEEDT